MSDSKEVRLSAPFAARRVLSLRAVRWFELDWHILVIALLLLGLGMAFIHAMAQADESLQREHDPIVFSSHVKKVIVCLPAMIAALAVRPRWLRRSAYAIYGLCIFLLLLVAVIGISKNGAKRWLPSPGEFELQPSELAKIGVILALARVLYRNRLQHLRDWGPPLLIALVPMGLVAKRPDLGTALTLVPITLGMLYLAGARASVLLRFILGAALLGGCLWQFQVGVKNYQVQRVDTWLHGFNAQNLIDTKNTAAFHSYHARVSIGHGGLLGTGLGEGVANQAGYLPERQCDSVFAVVAEEAGWLGTVAILLLYVVMIALIMGSAGGIRDRFSRLAVGGIALYFAAHFFINVGVNLGLVPMTGLTLPLFSTGGSSLLVTFVMLGLALGLASHHEPSLDRDSFTV
jgi:rod shape determining protein RodA